MITTYLRRVLAELSSPTCEPSAYCLNTALPSSTTTNLPAFFECQHHCLWPALSNGIQHGGESNKTYPTFLNQSLKRFLLLPNSSKVPMFFTRIRIYHMIYPYCKTSRRASINLRKSLKKIHSYLLSQHKCVLQFGV
jgi:hypothetical protein